MKGRFIKPRIIQPFTGNQIKVNITSFILQVGTRCISVKLCKELYHLNLHGVKIFPMASTAVLLNLNPYKNTLTH